MLFLYKTKLCKKSLTQIYPGNDSFITFEEILKYARSTKADMILLGGDLFHENKPSRKAEKRCIDLLRKYCLGLEKVNFQFLSDPAVNFKDCSFQLVNFEEPTLGIDLPIFSIHGNHDDPCGLSTYDVHFSQSKPLTSSLNHR